MVVIVVLQRVCGSAVRVDGMALAGADARGRVHRVLPPSAVRVDRAALGGADASGGVHHALPSSAVGVHAEAVAGTDARGGAHCALLSGLRRSEGVHAGALAGVDARDRVHRSAPVSRWGRCPSRDRPGAAWWSSSPVLRQPLGSIPAPWPARMWVLVFIRALRLRAWVRRWGPSPRRRRRGASKSCSSCLSGQPLGSTLAPWPARTFVVEIMCGSSGGCVSRWDRWSRGRRRARGRRFSSGAPFQGVGRPLGSMPAPWPARRRVRVLMEFPSGRECEGRPADCACLYR